jgi:hypothetical protein
VIDCGIVNEEVWERVEKFRIGERVESDHLETALRKRRGGKGQRRKEVGIEIKLFFLSAVLCLKKNVIRNRKARKAK